jgi:hypothetical protein
VQELAEESYRGAHRLLTDHRDLLDEIAERLLENEVIERDEIKTIMDRHRAGQTPQRSGIGTIKRDADGRRIAQPAEALASEPPEPPE